MNGLIITLILAFIIPFLMILTIKPLKKILGADVFTSILISLMFTLFVCLVISIIAKVEGHKMLTVMVNEQEISKLNSTQAYVEPFLFDDTYVYAVNTKTGFEMKKVSMTDTAIRYSKEKPKIITYHEIYKDKWARNYFPKFVQDGKESYVLVIPKNGMESEDKTVIIQKENYNK